LTKKEGIYPKASTGKALRFYKRKKGGGFTDKTALVYGIWRILFLLTREIRGPLDAEVPLPRKIKKKPLEKCVFGSRIL
jgi:hypothetical protein